ncbi:MAG: hypothetical protein ACREJ2_00495, partial [Planctomycetota bacterium]
AAAGSRAAADSSPVGGAAQRSGLEDLLSWSTQAIGRVWLIQVSSQRDWWAEGGRLELIDAESAQSQMVNVNVGAKEQFRQAAHDYTTYLERQVERFGGNFLAVGDGDDPFESLYTALQS